MAQAQTQQYTIQAPDGHMVTLEGPVGASQDEVIRQAQALYQPSTPSSVVNKAVSMGGNYLSELGTQLKGAASGIFDLATSGFTGRTPAILEGIVDASKDAYHQTGSDLGRAMDEVRKYNDGTSNSAMPAYFAARDAVGHSFGMVPLVGPLAASAYDASKESGAKAAAQMTMLIGPELLGFGMGKIKAGEPIIPPRVSFGTDLSNLMQRISSVNLHPAHLGELVQNALRDHIVASAQKPIEMIAEAKNVADTYKPVKQQLQVKTRLENEMSHDLIERLPPTPEAIEAAKKASTKKAPVEPEGAVLRYEGAGRSITGRAIARKLPEPTGSLEAYHDIGDALERKPGPPGSAATDTGKLGSGPPKMTTSQVLERMGRHDMVEQLKTADHMLETLSDDTTLHLMQQMLDKNPDTAYRVLLGNHSMDTLGKIRTMVGPQVYRAMSAQVLGDFLQSTWTLETAKDLGTTGVVAAGKKMLQGLDRGVPTAQPISLSPNAIGAKMYNILGASEFEKLHSMAKTMANTALPLSEAFPKLRPFLGPVLKRLGMGTGMSETIAITSRLMTRPEGMTNFREFVRAVGKSDVPRIINYGTRLGNMADRVTQPKKQDTPMPPPPPPG